jgi:hypothetical protein
MAYRARGDHCPQLSRTFHAPRVTLVLFNSSTYHPQLFSQLIASNSLQKSQAVTCCTIISQFQLVSSQPHLSIKTSGSLSKRCHSNNQTTAIALSPTLSDLITLKTLPNLPYNRLEPARPLLKIRSAVESSDLPTVAQNLKDGCSSSQ